MLETYSEALKRSFPNHVKKHQIWFYACTAFFILMIFSGSFLLFTLSAIIWLVANGLHIKTDILSSVANINSERQAKEEVAEENRIKAKNIKEAELAAEEEQNSQEENRKNEERKLRIQHLAKRMAEKNWRRKLEETALLLPPPLLT